MKLHEINNQGKLYFNVLPPKDEKPTGRMIVTILRAKADSQGSKPTEHEAIARSSKLWPNHKWDRRQDDDVSRAIVQKSRKNLKKNRTADWELELVADKNRHARDEETGGIYR